MSLDVFFFFELVRDFVNVLLRKIHDLFRDNRHKDLGTVGNGGLKITVTRPW
jgi:hypothetical protein